MFTLYSRPGSGSAAVEALLAELGVGFHLVDLPRHGDGPIPPDFYALNPRGEVPILRLPNDTLMTESAAMMIYLADLHPAAGLAPLANAPQRAAYLRWMIYFSSAVYMDNLRYYYSHRHSAEKAHAPAIKAKAIEFLDRDFAIFADALGQGRYILGDVFSAVDIYAAMLISWAPDLDALFVRHPNIRKLYDAVAARPKIAPVWKRNEMP
jgi:glutathione S-transferase